MSDIKMVEVRFPGIPGASGPPGPPGGGIVIRTEDGQIVYSPEASNFAIIQGNPYYFEDPSDIPLGSLALFDAAKRSLLLLGV